MPNFYCSQCNQPIHANDEDAGLDVCCPSCFRMVRVPGLSRKGAGTAPTWPWICLASLAAVGLAVVVAVMTPAPAVEASGPAAPSLFPLTVSPLIIAGVPTLLLAVLAGSIAMLLNRSFFRFSGLVYSIILLPLMLLTYLGDSLTGGKEIKTLTGIVHAKAAGLEQALKEGIKRQMGPSKAEMEVAFVGIKEDTEKVLTSMLDEDGMPKQTDLQFPTGQQPANDADRFRLFMQSFFTDMASLQNDYLKELEEAGIGTLLAADRVQLDKDNSQSTAMLGKIRLIVQKYKRKADLLVNGMPDRIQNSEFNAKIKADLQRGYKQGLARSMPMFQETWDIEVSLIEVIAKLLNHLDTTRKRWTMDNGQILFESQADVDIYNQFMTEIDSGVQRQTDIRQQSAKETMDRLNKL